MSRVRIIPWLYGLLAAILLFCGPVAPSFLSTPPSQNYFSPPENVALKWDIDMSANPVLVDFSLYDASSGAYDDLANYIFPTNAITIYIDQTRLDIYQKTTFRINNTVAADAGRYKCKVTSATAVFESIVDLSVRVIAATSSSQQSLPGETSSAASASANTVASGIIVQQMTTNDLGLSTSTSNALETSSYSALQSSNVETLQTDSRLSLQSSSSTSLPTVSTSGSASLLTVSTSGSASLPTVSTSGSASLPTAQTIQQTFSVLYVSSTLNTVVSSFAHQQQQPTSLSTNTSQLLSTQFSGGTFLPSVSKFGLGARSTSWKSFSIWPIHVSTTKLSESVNKTLELNSSEISTTSSRHQTVVISISLDSTRTKPNSGTQSSNKTLIGLSVGVSVAVLIAAVGAALYFFKLKMNGARRTSPIYQENYLLNSRTPPT